MNEAIEKLAKAKDEINLFAEILADPDENFICTLEQTALKHSANTELFEAIQSSFITVLNTFFFIGMEGIGFRRKIISNRRSHST